MPVYAKISAEKTGRNFLLYTDTAECHIGCTLHLKGVAIGPEDRL